MTTALLTLETVVLALVALFVVALLRSHAEILRRLAALERGEREAAVDPPPTSGVSGDGGRVPSGAGERAPDVVGETLAGDAVKLSLGPGAPTTLLTFLSSGCAACGPLWESLRAGVPGPAGARVVIVAKNPAQESVTLLGELAPHGRELLMSTQAWRDYAVPGSPHAVLVDGASGRVAGRGSAGSWERIVALVEQAAGDAAHVSSRAARMPADVAQTPAGAVQMPAGAAPPPAQARTTSERAARAERALAAAGIGPGHPSLYPAGGYRSTEYEAGVAIGGHER